MGNIAPGRPLYNTAANISVINCTFNVLASILTLVLMWFMNRNGTLRMNLFTKCIIWMTFYQMLLDLYLAFFRCGPSSDIYLCTSVFVGGIITTGLGTALFSLVGSLVALFMVEVGRKPTSIEGYLTFILIHIIMFAWSVPVAMGLYHSHNDAVYYASIAENYNYIRFALIGITIVIIVWLFYRMRQVTAGKDKTRSPLYHLTWRLIWYPVIQAVSRIGVASYAFIYKGNIDNIPENAGLTQLFHMYLVVLLTPLAGIGAFLVFLYTQRRAKQELKRLLLCNCTIQANALPRASELGEKLHQRSLADLSKTNSSPALHLPDDRPSDIDHQGPNFQSFSNNYVYEGSRPSGAAGHLAETDLNLDESRLMAMDETELMHQYIAEHDALIKTGRLSQGNLRLPPIAAKDIIPIRNPVHNTENEL
jgi:hypothetical protein